MSFLWRHMLKTTWWNEAFWWSPWPGIQISKIFLSNPLTALRETQKRENHTHDNSLDYLFFLRQIAWAAIFFVYVVNVVAWPFSWHLYFDNSELEQLGFHNFWIPCKNRWHIILLNRPCYSVWKRQYRKWVVLQFVGENLPFTFCPYVCSPYRVGLKGNVSLSGPA